MTTSRRVRAARNLFSAQLARDFTLGLSRTADRGRRRNRSIAQ
jgi:hypothetical protein